MLRALASRRAVSLCQNSDTTGFSRVVLQFLPKESFCITPEIPPTFSRVEFSTSTYMVA